MEASSYINFIGWKFDTWIQAKKFIHSLQVIYESWAAVSVKSSLYSQLNWLKNLTTKQRKKLPILRFYAAFLPNVFRVVEKLWTKQKSTKKTEFLKSEGHLLTSPGCCLTLASLLELHRLDLPLEAFSMFCWGKTFLISRPFKIFYKLKYNTCTFSLQK